MTKIEKYLLQNETEKAKLEVKQLLANQHKAEWTASKQEEYDNVYKTQLVIQDTDIQDEELPKEEHTYVEDAPTFQDWLNETRVVSEEVEEVSHIEVIDGIETKVIDVEYQPQVTELVRPYEPIEITDEMIENKLLEFGYDYKEKRKREYPPISEQLDMLFKADWDGWRDMIRAVKEKYPKPSEDKQ